MDKKQNISIVAVHRQSYEQLENVHGQTQSDGFTLRKRKKKETIKHRFSATCPFHELVYDWKTSAVFAEGSSPCPLFKIKKSATQGPPAGTDPFQSLFLLSFCPSIHDPQYLVPIAATCLCPAAECCRTKPHTGLIPFPSIFSPWQLRWFRCMVCAPCTLPQAWCWLPGGEPSLQPRPIP